MTIKAHLRSVLLADPVVSPLVNGINIYSGRAPQGLADDFIMIHCVGGDFTKLLRGSLEIRDSRFQVDCVSIDSDRAEALAGAVIDCLENYIGTNAGTTIHEVTITDDLDDTWSEDVGLYRRIVDMTVSHSK